MKGRRTVDIRQLRYVVEVAKVRNFTKASETLFVSQPALSKKISLIESELGFRLFERTTRSVTLTEDGAAFIRQAKSVMCEWDKMLRLADKLSESRKNSLSLGLFTQADYTGFPRVTAEFIESHAGVHLDVASYSEAQLMAKILDGSLDVAFFRGYAYEIQEGIATVSLFSDEIEILLNADDELASASVADLAQLTNYKLICEKDGIGNSYQSTLKDLQKLNLSIGQPAVYISQASMLPQLLSRPGYFSFTTRQSGALISRRYNYIKSVPVSDSPPVTAYVIYKEFNYNKDIEEFCSFVKEKFKN